ncbi:MAG TPA: hypothetical protein VFF06_04520 [Polyangia bacterium]|nr:hypothetical protein [Polyangia bacterium]
MLRLASLALLVAAAAPGCSRLMGYSDAGKPAPIRDYPDGADGLKALFTDVLDAAKKDDRDRVHDLLASTIMTDDDLTAVLGAPGTQLQPRYHALMATLANRGAVELVAQIYERKYDTVDVLAIDPKAKDARPEDRAVAAALTAPMPIYSVRLRRATDDKGLRYDFFFYRRGKWLTGNQLGKFLGQ